MIIPVLSAAEATAWDFRARESSGIPSRVLMETAGRAVATVLARQYDQRLAAGVVVVCGHGNNGGDGWVAARALAALGVPVTGVTVGGEPSPDNAANQRLALEQGVRVVAADGDWGMAPVVVDALLGTGATGAPRREYAAALERLMRLGGEVVAVDGPTGLDLTTGTVHAPCVRAALTVTFGGFRRGHLLQRTMCGRVVVAEIGFPLPDASWPGVVTDHWLAENLTEFRAEMHKGERGKILVIGGADGMAGAAIFAAKAALRSGAGLATLAASPASVQAAQSTNPDIMAITSSHTEVSAELAEKLEWADAVVIGPGLGRGAAQARFVRSVLERVTRPVLVDADALHAFRNSADELKGVLAGKRALLTPHRGEFAAVFPDLAEVVRHDPFAAAGEAAARVGQAVLLKGVPTVAAQQGVPLLVSATGNPGLATGGTGDVLAGIAACWLAQGSAPQVAGAVAAHLHGRAAEDVARNRSVRSLRPDDLLGVLSPLWRELAERRFEVLPPVLAELEAPAVT